MQLEAIYLEYRRVRPSTDWHKCMLPVWLPASSSRYDYLQHLTAVYPNTEWRIYSPWDEKVN